MTIKIKANNKIVKSIEMPEKWEDLDRSTQIWAIKMLINDETKVKQAFLRRLFGNYYAFLSSVELASLENLIDFVCLKASPKAALSYLSFDFKKYSFSDEFEACTIGQFIIANDAYLEMMKENSHNSKQNACILLYALTHHIEKDDELKISKLAKKFSDAPLYFFKVAILYFEGIRKMIEDLGQKSELFEDTEAEKKGFGWRTTLRQIAEAGIFGNYDEVWKRKFWEIFSIVLEKKWQYDELKNIKPNDD